MVVVCLVLLIFLFVGQEGVVTVSFLCLNLGGGGVLEVRCVFVFVVFGLGFQRLPF